MQSCGKELSLILASPYNTYKYLTGPTGRHASCISLLWHERVTQATKLFGDKGAKKGAHTLSKFFFQLFNS